MLEWNFDLTKAPRGKYVVVNRKYGKATADGKVFKPDRVILATKCGVVTSSQYLPEQHRREALGHGEQPVAWMPWASGALPAHPYAELAAA